MLAAQRMRMANTEYPRKLQIILPTFLEQTLHWVPTYCVMPKMNGTPPNLNSVIMYSPLCHSKFVNSQMTFFFLTWKYSVAKQFV